MMEVVSEPALVVADDLGRTLAETEKDEISDCDNGTGLRVATFPRIIPTSTADHLGVGTCKTQKDLERMKSQTRQ